jgi:hypothetical protein
MKICLACVSTCVYQRERIYNTAIWPGKKGTGTLETFIFLLVQWTFLNAYSCSYGLLLSKYFYKITVSFYALLSLEIILSQYMEHKPGFEGWVK